MLESFLFFKKKLQASGLQLYLKRDSDTGVFLGIRTIASREKLSPGWDWGLGQGQGQF